MMINIGLMEVPSVNALLHGCPIIEVLDLYFRPVCLDKVCVPPSLKRLRIGIKIDAGAYLEIDAPDLVCLVIKKITFDKVFSMYNLHNVVAAYLDVFPRSFGFVVIPLHNLLNALSGVKHLMLSRSTTKEQSPILGWAPQPSVPNCLVSHLNFIQFKGCQGFQDELFFIEYVLQNGLVLETMNVADISMDLQKKYDFLKRLFNVRKACEMCQVTFDTTVSPKV
ncbi:hypothetical protein TSUD_355780 [Trifolium subterraneum]|uniref:FBD domain-containing protein n=1 Tax=Trifolium subterraneum TaxID=3900 RepID=A0A2Z6N016_TRISU|nr:hypothetical protein TSUD_355780 [Trifolium subterraneum]